MKKFALVGVRPIFRHGRVLSWHGKLLAHWCMTSSVWRKYMLNQISENVSPSHMRNYACFLSRTSLKKLDSCYFWGSLVSVSICLSHFIALFAKNQLVSGLFHRSRYPSLQYVVLSLKICRCFWAFALFHPEFFQNMTTRYVLCATPHFNRNPHNTYPQDMYRGSGVIVASCD